APGRPEPWANPPAPPRPGAVERSGGAQRTGRDGAGGETVGATAGGGRGAVAVRGRGSRPVSATGAAGAPRRFLGQLRTGHGAPEEESRGVDSLLPGGAGRPAENGGHLR